MYTQVTKLLGVYQTQLLSLFIWFQVVNEIKREIVYYKEEIERKDYIY